MSFFTTEEFIEQVVPTIVGGDGNLAALFTNYNEIRGYPSGQVATGNPRLAIRVQNGYQSAGMSSVLQGMTAILTGNVVSLISVADELRSEASEAQDRVVENLRGTAVADQGSRVFAFVYAGYNAFQQSLDFVAYLRANFPHAVIAVLTCTCGFREEKQPVLERLVADGTVNMVIVTEQCGGRDDSKLVLEALLAAGRE